MHTIEDRKRKNVTEIFDCLQMGKTLCSQVELNSLNSQSFPFTMNSQMKGLFLNKG